MKAVDIVYTLFIDVMFYNPPVILCLEGGFREVRNACRFLPLVFGFKLAQSFLCRGGHDWLRKDIFCDHVMVAKCSNYSIPCVLQ